MNPWKMIRIKGLLEEVRVGRSKGYTKYLGVQLIGRSSA